MKNLVKNNSFLLKGYFMFVLVTISLGMISTATLVFFTNQGNQENNSQILKKEASNIHKTVSELFSYSNKINTYIGKQISEHGSKDLNFILKTFQRADKIQNKNAQLLSWSSFDWVDPNNLQLVNSRVGIRKNPPNMSVRQYTTRSPKNPWSLQVSFPVLGNPSESWVIPAGTGVTDENGQYLGTIVVGFDIAELSNVVEQRLSDPVSFVVLDEKMNIVIQSSDNELSADRDFYKNALGKFGFNKNSNFLSNDGLVVGNINYSFYQKFEDYPYLVLVGFNKGFLKKEFNSSILPIIVGFSSITAFFLIVLYIFKTRIMFLMGRERDLRNTLHNANISKTKLIRAASHDLKNYIFGISGLSNLILQSKKKSEISSNEDLKLVEEISKQSEELMGFVEDLLDTNQNESGEFSLGKMQVCDVVDLTQRMVILNKNFALENHVSLEAIKCEYDSLYINCDIRRLKQILNNLISNSIKYSPAESKVLITASLLKESNEICIEVCDNGIGMTSKEIEIALSGRGEAIDKSSLNKVIDSHGIGMPIIKKLVDLHKGRLEIDSKKGFGTKVKIYFKAVPNLKKEAVVEEDSLYKGIVNEFKNKSVLLAEDNPVGNKINTFLLRKMGFRVKHVENGQDVIKELDKQHFDLVFVDINMPLLNGFETAKMIRDGSCFKNFKNKNIPIIAISADKHELSELKHYGINAELSKPFSKKDLLDFVIEYINLS